MKITKSDKNGDLVTYEGLTEIFFAKFGCSGCLTVLIIIILIVGELLFG